MSENIIVKKCLSKYFEMVLFRDKLFEIRLNDFEIKPGNTLVLIEIDNNKPTGRELWLKVTSVFKLNDLDFYSKEKILEYGYQIIGFNPIIKFKQTTTPDSLVLSNPKSISEFLNESSFFECPKCSKFDFMVFFERETQSCFLICKNCKKSYWIQM